MTSVSKRARVEEAKSEEPTLMGVLTAIEQTLGDRTVPIDIRIRLKGFLAARSMIFVDNFFFGFINQLIDLATRIDSEELGALAVTLRCVANHPTTRSSPRHPFGPDGKPAPLSFA